MARKWKYRKSFCEDTTIRPQYFCKLFSPTGSFRLFLDPFRTPFLSVSQHRKTDILVLKRMPSSALSPPYRESEKIRFNFALSPPYHSRCLWFSRKQQSNNSKANVSTLNFTMKFETSKNYQQTDLWACIWELSKVIKIQILVICFWSFYYL
jgi:hypothetical protein